jgi:predicted nucleic acid-binding protein
VIVVDASVVANALADDADDGDLARSTLRRGDRVGAPDLLDVESVAVLRKRWAGGSLTARRFASAVRDLEDLPIERYPTCRLMRRAYELRDTVTPYDATYVALAEILECTLVTADGRLARAPGIRCAVEVVSPGG